MQYAFISALPLHRHSSPYSRSLFPIHPLSRCPRPRPLRHSRQRMASTSLNDPPPAPSPPPPSPATTSTTPTTITTIPSPQTPTSPSPPPLPLLFLSSLALLTALYLARIPLTSYILTPLSSYLSSLTSQLSSLPPIQASLLLALINFFTVLLCFPANMGLMIAAGALVGAAPAFLALFFSKLAAACVAFLLARGVLSSRAHKWLASRPRLARMLQETGSEGGWKFVLLMRLSPFPGFLLNYLLSLTGVSFGEYVCATMLGIAPSVSNLVLLGATAKGVVGGGRSSGGWLGVVIRAVCALSMVLVTVLIGRRARKVFQEVEEDAMGGAGGVREEAR